MVQAIVRALYVVTALATLICLATGIIDFLATAILLFVAGLAVLFAPRLASQQAGGTVEITPEGLILRTSASVEVLWRNIKAVSIGSASDSYGVLNSRFLRLLGVNPDHRCVVIQLDSPRRFNLLMGPMKIRVPTTQASIPICVDNPDELLRDIQSLVGVPTPDAS
ncbi:MAG TPA: hypothetical protein VMR52_01155 [Dehalococcoidia bacterium]|nr:hypothetical protein [Dehalococcoidia bacterium]